MKNLSLLILITTISFGSVADTLSSRTEQQPAQKTESLAIDDRLDVNKATLEQLIAIKGLGPAKAAAIIKYRKEIGGFGHIDELVGVRGIGQKALKKLKVVLRVKKSI